MWNRILQSVASARASFKNHTPLHTQARSLRSIAEYSLESTGKSEREDLKLVHLYEFMATYFGIYTAGIGLNDAVIALSLSGHGLNAMSLVRSQLDALLILAYFAEPHRELEEVERRVNEYLTWVQIKMKQNADKTAGFDLAVEFMGASKWSAFLKDVHENYEDIKGNCAPEEFNRLVNATSFPPKRKRVAETIGFESLYEHVVAEASATIHLADISDRMSYLPDPEFAYIYKYGDSQSIWPVMVSSLILGRLISVHAKFIEIEPEINPLVAKQFSDLHNKGN